jgi:hypothetical protein
LCGSHIGFFAVNAGIPVKRRREKEKEKKHA